MQNCIWPPESNLEANFSDLGDRFWRVNQWKIDKWRPDGPQKVPKNRQVRQRISHKVPEKLQRLPPQPTHQQLQELTKNRLKRTSFNHLAKSLSRAHTDILPASPEQRELLQDAVEWDTKEHRVAYCL